MSEKPITPTRIIPAGHDIPTAPPLPAAPHGAEDVPPWRTTAPPPRPTGAPPEPPPPPHGAGGEQRVVVEVWYPPAEPPQPEPDRAPRWSMAWAWQHAHPWKTAIGGAAALLPIPWTGYSLATTWAYTVDQSRDFGWAWGYGLAGAALALAVLADTRHARILTRLFLVVAVAGVLGAIDWYDPITILTGVTRS